MNKLVLLILLVLSFEACKPGIKGVSILDFRGRMGSGKWAEVHEKTRCDSMSPSQCLGFFGFAVRADGEYIVDSPEGGQPTTGKITDEELRALSEAARQEANVISKNDMDCESSQSDPGSRDSVDVTLENQSNYLVFDDQGGGSFCVRGTGGEARDLHSVMNMLMEKYYVTGVFE